MWNSKSINYVVKSLDSNSIIGLSNEEASKRLLTYGSNKLLAKKKKSLFKLFLEQIQDTMIYILIVAAVISFFLGETTDAIIILLIIVINAVIGVAQEAKAEKALDALKDMSAPKALVKRQGELLEIPSEEVVPGDIVIIDAGRYIPADLRLIESTNLKVDESAFTGESVPAEKDGNFIASEENISIGDMHNMAFMSTIVTYGRGVGIAVATGMDTEIGKIAKMLDDEVKEETPLQKKLSELGKILGFGSIGICLLIFIISIFQGRNLLQMLLTASSLAVAAIPEGLPAIVAIVLALGIQRMVKKNAIVKKLPSVETLGVVSVICSDKTGTLTQNKMTVTKFFTPYGINLVKNLNINNNDHKILTEAMILCNDATYSENSKTGDPTEIALLEPPFKLNISLEAFNNTHKRIYEVPFDSDRKLMTTVNLYSDHKRVYTKGAVDSLLKISNKILVNDNILDLTDQFKNEILLAVDEMSNDALRVLAFAYKDIDMEYTKYSRETLENNLIFVGMVGMIDPPREEAKTAIALCKKAGITPIMITGDYRNTAFAIAKDLNIAQSIDETISGADLDKMSQEDLNKSILKYKVFARVSPEHKVKIVKAFKANGKITSMTGDGVNDSPSLKAADIGVAMGITGTDVAKEASDMILTDDNFSTIVSAVEEGRKIYTNIKKSIIFLLSCNIGEIITLFIAILLNWNSPLLPIHILWVNLITDSFPALALGIDNSNEDVMKNTPRNPKEPIFLKQDIIHLMFSGMLIGTVTLIAFKVAEIIYPNNISYSQTMSFLVLSISQLFLSLSLRNTKKSLISIGIFSNKYLIYSIGVGILLQVLIVSITPLASIFKLSSLSINSWGLVILLSLVPFVIHEISKILLLNKNKLNH